MVNKNLKSKQDNPSFFMWEKKSFGACAELIRDHYKPNQNESLPYIGLEHIEKEKLQLVGIGDSLDISSIKFKFKKQDILFGKLRPYFRKIICPDFDGICSTDIFVVRGKNGMDHKFLYYWMATQEFVDLASSSSTGTRMPRANWDFLSNVEQKIPKIYEQEKISHVLWVLDEKIRNLKKQNFVLEKIIESVFKSWFVNFDGVTLFEDSELDQIPKGWHVEKLENFLELIKGTSYRSQDLKLSKKCLVTLKSIQRGGGYVDNGLKSFIGKYNENQVVRENDMIIAQTDLTQTADVIGKPAIVRGSKKFQTLIASLDLLIVKIKNDQIPKLYLYHLFLTDTFQNHIYGYVSGTTVLHLPKDAIPNYKFIVPPTKILEEFDHFASIMTQKNHENNDQLNSLIKIRDIIHPKLISGEIRI
jgi:type I restriction enzyme, S subunit